MGATEVEPKIERLGLVAGNGLERDGRTGVGPLVQRPSPARGVRMRTPWDGEREDRQRGESLTYSRKATTIRPMTREVLQTILRGATGLSEKAGTFSVASGHRVTFYLGTDGRGMVVNEVEGVKLTDAYVVLSTRETGDVFCDYGSVHALAVKPPKDNAPTKAGFA